MYRLSEHKTESIDHLVSVRSILTPIDKFHPTVFAFSTFQSSISIYYIYISISYSMYVSAM